MSMSTGAFQRLISTNPSALTSTEPNAPTSPRASTVAGAAQDQQRHADQADERGPDPDQPARSPMTAHAMAITARGEVACRVAARPPGRW